MIIRDVVDEKKMVNSVANLNIDVSNLFLHIIYIPMAEIAHGVVSDRPSTLKLALVSFIFQSRPIFPLLFSTKSRKREKVRKWERRQGYASLTST